ncbi:hypothetical protein [Nocardia crassostreae]|uniref:hypothetical protein n=1 Tax=Nocardia crassostreae TaxID=53428 RepID=UPI000AD69FDD|nr:hypothetical protein [Nocardia crassostreae]
MNNPPEQFIRAQHALSGADLLNGVTEHTGSAFFAIPPGIAPGESVAAGLGL